MFSCRVENDAFCGLILTIRWVQEVTVTDGDDHCRSFTHKVERTATRTIQGWSFSGPLLSVHGTPPLPPCGWVRPAGSTDRKLITADHVAIVTWLQAGQPIPFSCTVPAMTIPEVE